MTEPRYLQIIRQFRQNGLKFLLEDPHNLRELLHLTDEPAVRRLDFAALRLEPTAFVAPDYRHKESDLVFTIPLLSAVGRKRSRILVYILLEHQSEPDELLPLRVLSYVVEIYRHQVRLWHRRHASTTGLRLHPVLPVVFYTGTRTWESPGQLFLLGLQNGRDVACPVEDMEHLDAILDGPVEDPVVLESWQGPGTDARKPR